MPTWENTAGSSSASNLLLCTPVALRRVLLLVAPLLLAYSSKHRHTPFHTPYCIPLGAPPIPIPSWVHETASFQRQQEELWLSSSVPAHWPSHL